MEKKILDLVSDEIKRDTSNDGALKDALLNHLERLKEQRSNIMFVGATGV